MQRKPRWDDRAPRIALIVSNVSRYGKLPASFALLLAFTLGTGAGAEQGSSSGGAPSGPPGVRGGIEDGFGAPPGPSPALQERMAERRNSDRQKMLVADADKLLLLAQQLRDEVAKSNKDELSVPVLKKSEEIEKLAKSVKEKMRGY